MDIKIDKLYYYLKLMDGGYYIFLREQVINPLVSVTQLGLFFENEDDAKECVKKMNETK